MKRVGLQLYDNNGKFKGLKQIITEMRPILARMTDKQRDFFLTTIAGSEQMKVFTNLLGTTEEGFKIITERIENYKGAVDEAYEMKKDTPEAKIKALASAWDTFKLKIAEAASPAITGLVEDLTKKVNELADSDTFSKENVEAFFEAIREGGKTAIEILDGIGLALEPIVWGLKTIGKTAKVGREIGTGLFTPLNEKQLAEETEIMNTYKKIAMINPKNEEEEEKKKKMWMQNKKKEAEFLNNLRELHHNKWSIWDMETYFKDRGLDYKTKDSVDKNVIEEQYYNFGGGNNLYRDKKPQKKIVQEKDKKDIFNGNKYVIKPPERQKSDLEKVSDKLGLKAPVSPLSTTFSPQVNVNMGGVVIRNEADIEKTAELSKQKIIKELNTFIQITK